MINHYFNRDKTSPRSHSHLKSKGKVDDFSLLLESSSDDDGDNHYLRKYNDFGITTKQISYKDKIELMRRKKAKFEELMVREEQKMNSLERLVSKAKRA